MKNLANYKISVRTREYLIQAIYQMIFDNQSSSVIISQFKNEHKAKKVDFKMFSQSLKSIEKNKIKIDAAIDSLDINKSSIQIIDKSVLYFAINEILYGSLDQPITIDESIRLSKKFSSPDSFKFINASLDKFIKKLR